MREAGFPWASSPLYSPDVIVGTVIQVQDFFTDTGGLPLTVGFSFVFLPVMYIECGRVNHKFNSANNWSSPSQSTSYQRMWRIGEVHPTNHEILNVRELTIASQEGKHRKAPSPPVRNLLIHAPGQSIVPVSLIMTDSLRAELCNTIKRQFRHRRNKGKID